jgi:hypothetical protein
VERPPRRRGRGLDLRISHRVSPAFALACLIYLIELSCHGDHLPCKSSPAVAPERRRERTAPAPGRRGGARPSASHVNGGAEGRRDT